MAPKVLSPEEQKYIVGVQANLWTEYNYAGHAFDITANLVPDSTAGVVKVAFKTIDNCPIHYTLDGSEPTEASPLYEDTLKITEACTINAVGIRPTGKSRIFTQKVDINKATL